MDQENKDAVLGGNGDPLRSHACVAKELGVSLATVKDWSQMGMPGSRGAYYLDEIVKWRAANIKTAKYAPKGNARDVAGLDEEEQIARIRKLVAEAEAKERINEIENSKLVYLEDVQLEMSQHITWVKNRLDGLPNELAAEIPAHQRAQLIEVLRTRIEQIILKWSEWTPGSNDDDS